MWIAIIILLLAAKAEARASCEPLSGIFKKVEGPSKLTGDFNFTSTHFNMSLAYNGTTYSLGDISYKTKSQEISARLCWVHIPNDVINRIPKTVIDHVGLPRLYWSEGELMLPVRFGSNRSIDTAYFKK
ncbi:hypothetical protein Pmar_PMAR019739 [Perkinsus marinus ATCC 50983]|uniref:Uncharacterized protein n=1 Tax=Perkinsus marinus (strain ATCC 50983 / TXsc) TaxID=423536 RepID=C5LW21_PERM5|nr:hypothetical protein Pmar_PMAR019739 [Perkinsus marinus ATCC 50983]EEQ99091.1 hypothetical protein Pmar_PMAR019739 [Perkinsus marinus ATCC 50983]|eukprot:XP_002766374.1 hypothetical protein Pmar_PMAR019739 [Perkinsus marinus ATCC 50983]